MILATFIVVDADHLISGVNMYYHPTIFWLSAFFECAMTRAHGRNPTDLMGNGMESR